MNSTRLPGKMLLKLNGETLIERAWRIACAAFEPRHCIVAIPAADVNGPLYAELCRIGARVNAFDGDEANVLSRFWVCAYTFRWHPDSIIVRYTPDDPFKSAAMLRRVVAGERLPIEQGGEAFTLGQLDVAHCYVKDARMREHLTYAFFGDVAPPMPPRAQHPWSIDTQADYDAAVAYLNLPAPSARRDWENQPFRVDL